MSGRDNRGANNPMFGVHRFGSAAANWKGGRRISRRNGRPDYIRVYSPDHPHAHNGSVYEHRLVAEAVLGRYLHADEIVHHKDGNGINNDPDNLQVMTQAEHVRLHRTIHRWSRHHDACTACGGTEREHEGHGLCSRCFQRAKRQRAA